jgi:hypothetical protein
MRTFRKHPHSGSRFNDLLVPAVTFLLLYWNRHCESSRHSHCSIRLAWILYNNRRVMMHEGLPLEDVTDIADDDGKLSDKYKAAVHCSFRHSFPWSNGWQTGIDGIIEEVVPKPFCVRGPFDHATAIIVWLRSGVGTVKVFLGDRNVVTWQTSPGAPHRVMMAFLEPGYYCWWMKGAKVKYVQKAPSRWETFQLVCKRMISAHISCGIIMKGGCACGAGSVIVKACRDFLVSSSNK